MTFWLLLGAAAAWVVTQAQAARAAVQRFPGETISISTQAKKPVGGVETTRAPGPAFDPIIRASTSAGAWTLSQLQTMVRRAGLYAGLPAGLLEAIVTVESAWNPTAENRVTKDYGLCQINVQHFGKPGFPADIQNALDPRQSVAACVLLVSEGRDRWGSDWPRVISEYNGGPTAARTTPFRNQGYVDLVSNKWSKIQASLA